MARRCRRFTMKDAKAARRRVRLPASVSCDELLEGMNVEREHSDLVGCDPVKTAKIAAAHLRERRDYYPRLKRFVEG